MKMNKKGFTLIEIMIVVAIIGILAAIAIPNFVRYRKQAQANACIGNLKQLQSAVEQARMSGTTTINEAAIIGTDKYIKASPSCPKVNSYVYQLDTSTDTNLPKCNAGGGDAAPFAHKLPDDTTSGT